MGAWAIGRRRRRTRLATAVPLAALLAVLVAGACSSSGDDAGAGDGGTVSTVVPPVTTPPPAGRVVVRADEPTGDQALVTWQRMAAPPGARSAYQDLADALSAQLVLPQDIGVRFRECGEVNAYWSPSEQAVTLCYELLQHVHDGWVEHANGPVADLQEQVDASAEADRLAGSTALFTLSHELAHALIDVLDLPVTGREEDVADEFAALLLLENRSEVGERAVSDTAALFNETLNPAGRFTDTPFWDEHAVDEQRFYNLVCFLYGQSPEGRSQLVTLGYLPEARAVRCPAEYEQKRAAWARLLGPHLRTPLR